MDLSHFWWLRTGSESSVVKYLKNGVFNTYRFFTVTHAEPEHLPTSRLAHPQLPTSHFPPCHRPFGNSVSRIQIDSIGNCLLLARLATRGVSSEGNVSDPLEPSTYFWAEEVLAGGPNKPPCFLQTLASSARTSFVV